MKIKFALILALVIGLAGCGGSEGGGSSSGGTTVTTTTTTTIPVSTIVGVVSPANYSNGTVQRDVYDYLNSQRQTCGFGLLQQEFHIDTAAQAHSNWMVTNGQAVHYENQTTYPNGFTGVTPGDRLSAAGYNWTTGDEVLSVAVNAYGTTLGHGAVMDFFVAPYHGYGQLLGNRDIGIGSVDIPPQNGFGEQEWHTFDMGSTTARPMQLLGGTDVATYPCNGVTGVLSKSYQNEIPAPIPGRSLSSNPIGHPIYIKVRDGQTLVLTTYSLRQVGTSIDLSMILLNRSNDTASIISDDSTAILMPSLPLLTNTSYFFTATGTNNGRPITVNFTFSTGVF